MGKLHHNTNFPYNNYLQSRNSINNDDDYDHNNYNDNYHKDHHHNHAIPDPDHNCLSNKDYGPALPGSVHLRSV